MNPLPFLLGNLWRTGCLALLLIVGVQTFRVDHYRSAYRGEKAAHAATIAGYRAAQAEALRKAEKAKADTEAHYRHKAEIADHAYKAQLADARSATDAYIRAHRVRLNPASPAGGTVAGPDSGGAEGGERSGDDAELVTITPEDIEICTANSVRLQAVREWALSLGL